MDDHKYFRGMEKLELIELRSGEQVPFEVLDEIKNILGISGSPVRLAGIKTSRDEFSQEFLIYMENVGTLHVVDSYYHNISKTLRVTSYAYALHHIRDAIEFGVDVQ